MASYGAGTNIDNEQKYLDNLKQNGNAGQKAWAAAQQKELNKYKNSQTTTSAGPSYTSSSGSSSGGSGNRYADSYGHTSSNGSPPSGGILPAKTGSGSSGNYSPTAGSNGTSGGQYASFDYDKEIMSPEDYALTQQASNIWWDGYKRGDKETMDSASAWAESIRKKYNYSGGDSGNQYIWLGNDNFYYPQQAPVYENEWQDEIEERMMNIANSSFEDWSKGSDYQYLYDRYSRGGEQAMEDMLGQLAARSGGYASSYAVAAAQQQYNNYMATLEDAARAMYQDDLNRQMQALGLIGDYESTQYNRYLDELNQWQGDRDFAYNQFWDNWNRDYTLNRDEIEDARYEEESDFNKAADYAAATGDYSLFVDMGYYTPEQAERLRNQWLLQNVAGYSGGGSGGSSKGSSSSKKTKSGRNDGDDDKKPKEPLRLTYLPAVDITDHAMAGTGLSAGGQQVLNSIRSAKTTVDKESALMAGVAAGLIKDTDEARKIANIAGIRLVNLPTSV